MCHTHYYICYFAAVPWIFCCGSKNMRKTVFYSLSLLFSNARYYARKRNLRCCVRYKQYTHRHSLCFFDGFLSFVLFFLIKKLARVRIEKRLENHIKIARQCDSVLFCHCLEICNANEWPNNKKFQCTLEFYMQTIGYQTTTVLYAFSVWIRYVLFVCVHHLEHICLDQRNNIMIFSSVIRGIYAYFLSAYTET